MIRIVHAQYDGATAAWSTNGADIPGLFCESATLAELIEAVLDAAPALLYDYLGIPAGKVVEIVVRPEPVIVACVSRPVNSSFSRITLRGPAAKLVGRDP